MPTFVYMTRCDGCGQCVDICPSDIMHIDPVVRRAYNIEPNMCWECYSCVKACPHNAIVHRRAASAPIPPTRAVSSTPACGRGRGTPTTSARCTPPDRRGDRRATRAARVAVGDLLRPHRCSSSCCSHGSAVCLCSRRAPTSAGAASRTTKTTRRARRCWCRELRGAARRGRPDRQ